MKKTLFWIFASVLLISSIQANACPRSAQQLLCPGDKVYPSDYKRGYGIVKAINPQRETIVVQGNMSDNLNTYQKQELAISFGCLGHVCVDDTVIPANFVRGYGKVQGVNPYKQTVIVLGNFSDKIYEFRLDELAITHGCYFGFCVDDTVIPSDFKRGYGKIVGINFMTGKIAVVGDLSDKIYFYETRNLSNSEYCLTYSNSERTGQIYPDFSQKNYLIPELNFRLK